MKKKRYLPFGYHMVDGVIEIVPAENILIQEIFHSYLAGASLQQLATFAEQTGLKFRENTDGWNKNMISRMLDDKRYWNGNKFPPIISKELAEQVSELKTQKATPKSSIQLLKKQIYCPQCGFRLIRNSQSSPRIFWICRRCGIKIGPVSNNELLWAVTEKLLDICQEPQKVEPEQSSSNSLSIQAARLTNEINQMLEQREVDTNKVLSLILECAAEKYKTCSIKESDHLTIKLKTLFQEHSNDEKLDRELFEQAVKQVILQQDGSIKFQLLNGKIL